jgi:hypothetical protein
MKTALARFLVAVLFVLTSALNLVGALLKLLGASVSWLTSRIPQRASAPAKAASGAPATSSTVVGHTAPMGVAPTVPMTRPNLRIVAGAPSKADQLVAGLMNLGFMANDVRAFVHGLGDKVYTDPMADLIKAGIAACAKSRAS